MREVQEECGRALRLIGTIGETVQYFFAAADGRYYAMRAVFFRTELAEGALGPAECEMCWLDVSHPEPLFFHACLSRLGSASGLRRVQDSTHPKALPKSEAERLRESVAAPPGCLAAPRHTQPNKGLQATANSLRSCLASATRRA